MGNGATPHGKEARGAAPNPASFLKRKRERRIAENVVFGGGIMDFAEIRFCLAGEYEIFRKYISACREIRDFPEIHFRLAREIRVFAEVRRLTGGKALS